MGDLSTETDSEIRMKLAVAPIGGLAACRNGPHEISTEGTTI